MSSRLEDAEQRGAGSEDRGGDDPDWETAFL
jgi:hypothetical protein